MNLENFKLAVADFSKPYEDVKPHEFLPDEEPNVRISEKPDGSGHYLFIDIDLPHEYVPSSTEGHGHLIIDVPGLSFEGLVEIYQVMVKHRALEAGFGSAAAKRGHATLRLPHVKKETT